MANDPAAGSASPEELEALKENLRRFLEIHLGTRLVEVNNGSLTMLSLLAKKTNTKIKDKLINYKLNELGKRLLVERPVSRRDFIICEFLMEELNKYIASKLR